MKPNDSPLPLKLPDRSPSCLMTRPGARGLVLDGARGPACAGMPSAAKPPSLSSQTPAIPLPKFGATLAATGALNPMPKRLFPGSDATEGWPERKAAPPPPARKLSGYTPVPPPPRTKPVPHKSPPEPKFKQPPPDFSKQPGKPWLHSQSWGL
jgi:hypothetical protein